MLIALLALVACSEPPTDGSPGDSATDTSSTDTSADSGGETGSDTAGDVCAGLTTRAWDASGTTGDFDTVAPDLTVTQYDGSTWTWSEHFTGCDSVVGVTWMPDYDYPDFTRAADVKDWLLTSPRNVHYLVYASTSGDPSEALDTAYTKLHTAINNLDDDDLTAWWTDHIHLVTDDPYGNSWVGTLNQTYRTKYPIGWGIDRFQTVRELGYLSDPAQGWNETPPSFLNYEVQHFNVESDRQDRLDAQDATVIRAFDAAPQSSGWAETVTFPPASAMSDFDSMELDLTMACGGHPEPQYCGEWDYLTYAYLCPVDDAGTTDVDESSTQCVEFGRFITTYARSGRWTVDATPFLALLQDGGDRVIRFGSSNAYNLTLDIRLYDRGTAYRPVGLQYLWSGGDFNESYDSLHPDITFTPPANTDRVDVFGLITGHGYGKDEANCAEFCNHQHEFTVNAGTPHLKEEPEAGNSYGCGDHVMDQTVPNQYGTWVFGRGGWCPGKQVDPWSAEVTDDVNLSGENTIAYRGLFQGETYVPVPHDSGQGFGAGIVASTWLVYYQSR